MRIASIIGPYDIGMEFSAGRLVPAMRTHRGRPPFAAAQRNPNLGDWFITASIQRMLDFEDLHLVAEDADGAAFDYINTHCDALIMKGGNYLARGFASRRPGFWRALDRIRIPVVMIGSGIQGALDEDLGLDAADVDALARLHARCASSAVRGERSAELLARYGIDNVSVTGCPTLFWEQRQRLSIAAPERNRAVFTFRNGLINADRESHRKQFEALAAVRRQTPSVRVALQGEEVLLQDLYMAEQWGVTSGDWWEPSEIPGLFRVGRTPFDPEALRAEVLRIYAPLADRELLDWMTRATFFSWDIDDYLDLYRQTDLVVGCRVHGNLMALSQGTPTYFLLYDQRIQEVAELLHAPRHTLRDLPNGFDPFDADWTGTERAYRDLRNRMIHFLEMNGLRHRLGTADTEDPSGS